MTSKTGMAINVVLDVSDLEKVRALLADAANEIESLRSQVAELQGAIRAQDAMNLAATERLGIEPSGCDTSDRLADEVESLRSQVAQQQRDFAAWASQYGGAIDPTKMASEIHRLRSQVAERDREIEQMRWDLTRTGADHVADLSRQLTEATTAVDALRGSERAWMTTAEEFKARLTEAEARAEKAVAVATALAGIVVGNAVRRALAATPASPPADRPHPEQKCGRCGGPNVMPWSAPSPIWNAVMRHGDGAERFGGIVCPTCFAALAEESGHARGCWRFTNDSTDGVEWVAPDGRVWDHDLWLWVRPSVPADRPTEGE